MSTVTSRVGTGSHSTDSIMESTNVDPKGGTVRLYDDRNPRVAVEDTSATAATTYKTDQTASSSDIGKEVNTTMCQVQ